MCRDITNGLRNTRLKFSDPCWLVWTSQMLISPSRPQVTIAWSCDTNPTWPISERKKRTKNARKHQEETCFLKLWEEEQARCSWHWKVRALVTQSLWYLTRDLPRIYRSWAPRKRGSVCALQQVYRTNFGVLESWKEIPSTSFFEFGTLFWSSSPRRPVFLQASHQAWALGPSQLHPKGKRSPWRKTTAIADIVKSSEHMCWIRTHPNV